MKCEPYGAPQRGARPVLTPYERREEIIAEANKHASAQARERSLRRRLTVLDRKLDDREARALDRLAAWLLQAANPGNAPYWAGTKIDCGRSSDAQGEAFRREIALALAVHRGLDPEQMAMLQTLLNWLDPDSGKVCAGFSERFLDALKDLAASVASAYETLARRAG